MDDLKVKKLDDLRKKRKKKDETTNFGQFECVLLSVVKISIERRVVIRVTL